MQRDCCKHANDNGFTLVELMVVVALVAILAAVATPAYFNHTMRSRQTLAISELMMIKAAQERYFAEHGFYTGNIHNLEGYAGAGIYTNQYYQYTIIANTTGMITAGTVRAMGDLNSDGSYTNIWELPIQDMAAKPQQTTVGTEGFSWSSLAALFD